MQFIVKTHQGPHGTILVVTDSDILNQKFEENDLQLDLTKDFYQGEQVDEKKMQELVKSAYILHLTGQKTIDLFIKLKLVDSKNILIIQSIPHAEVYVVEN